MVQSVLTTSFAVTTSAYQTNTTESQAQTKVLQSNLTYGDFTYDVTDDGITITSYYAGRTENLIIPEKIDGIPITYIGEWAFSECKILKSIQLPDTVKGIRGGAFRYCTNLKTINLPDGLTSIGSEAFKNCENLTNVELPDNLIQLGGGAFSYCIQLQSINIPDNITTIEKYVFYGCNNLTSIEIPNTLTNVRELSFQHTALTDIYYKGTEDQYMRITLDLWYTDKFRYATPHYNFSGIAFEEETVDLNTGDIYTPKVITFHKSTLKWASGNKEVATVDSNGKVTAKGAGTANIKVTTADGKTAKFKVNVKAVPTSVNLNKTSLIMGLGESFNLKATVPDVTEPGEITFTSNKKNIVSVNKNGKLTTKAVGTAIITATTYNGKTATCRVTVKKAPTSISINRKNSIMGLGETFYLEGSLANDEASRVLTFSSNKPEVATVTEGGIVTAKSIGTAIVSITTYNGQKATCRVTVRNAPTSLQFNKTSITLKQGETFYLESQFNTGEYARTVIYNSPNKAVATISGSGVIMAKSKGTVKITGKTYNGKTQTCTVTVK